MMPLKYAPLASPAGFHHVALESSATAVKAPAMPCARAPTVSLAWARATSGAEASAKDARDTSDMKALHIAFTLMSFARFAVVQRRGRGGVFYPTRTAAATTVVQRPFLSPTALCVTFCT